MSTTTSESGSSGKLRSHVGGSGWVRRRAGVGVGGRKGGEHSDWHSTSFLNEIFVS